MKQKNAPPEQLPLWNLENIAMEESKPPEHTPPRLHNHMELHYDNGDREIVCCSAPGPRIYRKDNSYAGFVGMPMQAEQCSICNQRKALKNK